MSKAENVKAPFKGYFHHIRSHVGGKTTKGLMIGLYWPEGGTAGEFWLPTENLVEACVCGDSFHLFRELSSFFSILAELGDDPTEKAIIEALESDGFVNITS